MFMMINATQISAKRKEIPRAKNSNQNAEAPTLIPTYSRKRSGSRCLWRRFPRSSRSKNLTRNKWGDRYIRMSQITSETAETFAPSTDFFDFSGGVEACFFGSSFSSPIFVWPFSGQFGCSYRIPLPVCPYADFARFRGQVEGNFRAS